MLSRLGRSVPPRKPPVDDEGASVSYNKLMRYCVVAAAVALLLGSCRTDGPEAAKLLPWWQVPWPQEPGPWPTCEAWVGQRTLADKAAYYDWIATALHMLPESESYSTLVYQVHLEGAAPTSIVEASLLPRVTSYDSNENSGLWSSLYVASQAYRYAATGDPEALANVRRTLSGTLDLMKITGVPGLFARDMRNPALLGVSCPSDMASYVPPGDDMVGNRWVRVDENGCHTVWDPVSGSFVRRGGCTERRFAGYCWQSNVSRDEYSGHMFAAGVVARLVDAPDVRAMAEEVLRAVAYHMIDHAYAAVDYDGRPTKHGAFYALTLRDLPGFQALLALTWLRTAASVTDDTHLSREYYECLLQQHKMGRCIDQPNESPYDYRKYLSYIGQNLGCETNYDGVSMATLAYANAVWFSPDVGDRETFRAAIRGATGTSVQPDIAAEANPVFNFLHVALAEGTLARPEAEALVEAGICSLKRFRSDNIQRAFDSTIYPEMCTSIRHGSLTKDPVPVEERCPRVFEWWGNPRQRESCGEDLTFVHSPAGYLLPYWMGRYFGFISADQ